jgi:hypothetical protein
LGELIAAAMGGGAHTVLNLGAMRKLGRLLIVVNCKTPSFAMLFIFIWSQTIATSLAPTRWQISDTHHRLGPLLIQEQWLCHLPKISKEKVKYKKIF